MIRVTFQCSDGSAREVEGTTGQNLMSLAIVNSIPGIDGDCGGSMACGTCHVKVNAGWLKTTGPAAEFERALLSVSLDPQPNSRLACQIHLTAELDGLVVQTPESQRI